MDIRILGLLGVQFILLLSRGVDVHVEFIFNLNEEESTCND